MMLKLAQFARAEIGRAFVWGETNCVMLACRWLDAAQGTDIAPRYRYWMASKAKAAAWVRKRGARGLVDTLLAEGLAETPLAFAQPGDVLISGCDKTICAHVLMADGRLLSSTVDAGARLFRRDEISPPEWAVGWREASCPPP